MITAGCESHRVHREVVVDEPRETVVDGPGVEVVSVEPDPVERVYVYDEGYPPGTYVYNNYYYYQGRRYPRDVFITRYVRENVRQHRYVNVEDNRRQGQRLEQTYRSDYSRNHQQPAGRSVARPEQAPVRQYEAPRPTVQHPESRVPTNEEHRTVVRPPDNRSSVTEERRENRSGVERSENKLNPANDPHKPTPNDVRRDEPR